MANALLLDGYGHEVTVWGHDPAYVETCRKTRRNELFLKGVELPGSLRLPPSASPAIIFDETDLDSPEMALKKAFVFWKENLGAGKNSGGLVFQALYLLHIRLFI